MSYAIVDQDGLMLGDDRGPFTFPRYADARLAASRATARIGGRFRYSVERYEAHGRMRDTIEIPEGATNVQPDPKMSEAAPKDGPVTSIKLVS